MWHSNTQGCVLCSLPRTHTHTRAHAHARKALRMNWHGVNREGRFSESDTPLHSYMGPYSSSTQSPLSTFIQTFFICTLFEFNAFSRNNVEEVSPETSLQSRQLSLSLSLFTPFYPLSPTPPLTWENEAVPNAPAHMLHKKKIFVFLNNYSCSGEWQQSEWNKKPWLTALRICRAIIEWREMGEDVTNVTAVESAVYFSKKTKVQ